MKSRKKFLSSPIEEIRRVSEPLYKIPESVQQIIEIEKISKTGIFQSGGRYSKTYSFEDINYECEPMEEQIAVFKRYGKLLECIGTEFKVTTINRKRNMKQLKEDVCYKYRNDRFDQMRDFFNDEIEKSLEGGNQGIESAMYLTVSVEKNDFEEAKAFFITLEATLSKKFLELGSKMHIMTGEERLNLIRSIYQQDDEYAMPVSIDDYVSGYRDFLNDISCANFRYENMSVFRLNEKYGQALYISRYGNKINDRLLKRLCSTGAASIVTTDYISIPNDLGKKYVENKLMGAEKNIDRQQRKRNKDLAFASEISRKVKKEKEDIESILDLIDEHDQSTFFMGTTLVVFADTQEDLSSKVDTIKRIAADDSCKADVYAFKMREAFNTVLPLGVRQVENTRFAVTRSAAAMFPFTVQELYDRRPGAFWYGSNLISRNSIFANRKRLNNGNAFVFGLTGFGKSVFLKSEMLSVFLNTADDIIIIDPTLEYKAISQLMDGEFVDFANGTEKYINPLKAEIGELDFADMKGIIADMTEFMEGFCEKAIGRLDAISSAAIDEAVKNMFLRQIKEKSEEVILNDFMEELSKIKRAEAENIVYAMQKYTTGSLNIFNHRQNVNIKNRVTCFGMSGLGDTMRPLAMMVVLMSVKRKILENFRKGRATWLYVDEFHEVLGSEYSETFFIRLIKEIRKQGGLPCCATQNVADILKSAQVRTMVDNSEFILMLKQSAGAIPELTGTINGMKETYEDYLLEAEPGEGMMKFGNMIFPVSLKIDREGQLYNLFNTNMHEKSGAI